MSSLNTRAVELLTGLLEQSNRLGFPLDCADLEKLLPRFGIQPGDRDHFLLAWSDYQSRLASGDTCSFERHLDSHPDWRRRLSSLQRVNACLDNLPTADRAACTAKLAQLGWQVESPLADPNGTPTFQVKHAQSKVRALAKLANRPRSIRQLTREFLLHQRLQNSGWVQPHCFGADIEGAWLVLEDSTPVTCADPSATLEDLYDRWIQAADALGALHRLNFCHNALTADCLRVSTARKNPSTWLLAGLGLTTKPGKPVRRKPDLLDPPQFAPGEPATQSNDVYRLAGIIRNLLLQTVAPAGTTFQPSRKSTYFPWAPPTFRQPLSLCLHPKRSERISTGQELARLLRSLRPNTSPLPDQPTPIPRNIQVFQMD